MAVDITTLVPLTLTRDMVRVVFPVNQDLNTPAVSALPGLAARWNFASTPGTPVIVTYGFSATAPAYTMTSVSDVNSYSAFTAGEIAATEVVLAAYAAVCGITFSRVADPADAQMVYRKTSTLSSTGLGFFPPTNSFPLQEYGDVFIQSSAAGQAYITFHETGHALGLAHPFDTNKPTPESFGIAGSRLLSVVDQRLTPKPYYVTQTGGGGVSIDSIFHPTTPMPLDILALQMIYGKNLATNAGDTVYSYAVNPNFFQTIWDGGGNDTIDCSNQVNPCLITLIEGTYSAIGYRDPFTGLSQSAINFALSFQPADKYNDGSNMLAIAFDAVIENAIGGKTADRLIGNAVANVLTGGPGDDTMTAGAGNDTLNGGTGADKMDGGQDDDTYVVDTQADLLFEATGQGTDSVTSSVSFYLYDNIENITLTTGTGDNYISANGSDNTLTGNEGVNLLIGWDGNDTINGGAGNDVIYGVNDNDSLNGEAGVDVLIAGEGNDTLDGGDNPDELYGETGNDLIFGGTGFFTDILVGGTGNDTLDGSANPNSGQPRNQGDFDYLYGGTGDDTYIVDTPADLVFEFNGLTEGNDTVIADINGAGFYLYDGIENLTLINNTPFGVGNAQDNTLTGNGQSNYLLGGAGNDTLNGKVGNDVLFGEAGADTFTFERGTGGDVIGDFQQGQDKIKLVGIGYNAFADLNGHTIQNGNVGAIDLGAGDFIVLHNVQISSLTAADFIFA